MIVFGTSLEGAAVHLPLVGFVFVWVISLVCPSNVSQGIFEYFDPKLELEGKSMPRFSHDERVQGVEAALERAKGTTMGDPSSRPLPSTAISTLLLLHIYTKMKTVAALALLAGSVAAFAPQQESRASTSLAAFEDALGVQKPLGFWYVFLALWIAPPTTRHCGRIGSVKPQPIYTRCYG